MINMTRIILAALIGISIAVVPANGGVSISTKPVEMSMGDQADMPCCPTPDEGKGSVACAFKCLNFVAVTFPAAIALAHATDRLPPAPADGALWGYVTPPINPPPI